MQQRVEPRTGVGVVVLLEDFEELQVRLAGFDRDNTAK